jgi:hypothetical protein
MDLSLMNYVVWTKATFEEFYATTLRNGSEDVEGEIMRSHLEHVLWAPPRMPDSVPLRIELEHFDLMQAILDITGRASRS